MKPTSKTYLFIKSAMIISDYQIMKQRDGIGGLVNIHSGARPTKHISIEFEIRWKFKTL